MNLIQKKELLIYTLKQEIFKEYVMCLIKIGDLKKAKLRKILTWSLISIFVILYLSFGLFALYHFRLFLEY